MPAEPKEHNITIVGPVIGLEDQTPWGELFLCDGYAWLCDCHTCGSGHNTKAKAQEEAEYHLEAFAADRQAKIQFPPPPEAADLGHDLAWDPGAYPRYTCRTCGCGTLKVTTFWYGSAVERPCTPNDGRQS